MPMYEYQCKACEAQFEVMQSLHADPEDTACPHCKAKQATRLLSAFASKIVGDHKPGFSEMKAYNMLDQRMDKLKKLPPMFGKRATPPSNVTSSSDSGSTGEGGAS